MTYLIALLVLAVSFLLVRLFIPVAMAMAVKFRALDDPSKDPSKRKIHIAPKYRLGGVAIFLAFFAAAFLFADRTLVMILFLPTLIVFIAGFIDDIKPLAPAQKVLFQITAALVAVWMGVEIGSITNPFGGVFDLHGILILGISLPVILTLVWIVGLINVVNFSDGLDGLTAGVSGIAGSVLLSLTLLRLDQPELGILFAILAGVSFGFLPYNFYPSKIFMGDSGSMTLGILLAILSIISGSKIPVAVLVLGFPVLDFAWTILRRLSRTGFMSIFKPDRSHLHHLLLDAGFTQREVVVFFYFISLVFGILALMSQTFEKLIGFFALSIVTIGVFGALLLKRKRSRSAGTR